MIGVSKDTVRSHANFKAKYDLPFTLLADPEREVLALYDVLKEKTDVRQEGHWQVRTTYLIDENGVIIRSL